jgi:folylpolyglutamate synthase/dihydrofolate synthase
MIDLGLARITRLLSVLGNPHLAWKAVHVAGTNGKGSVCAYISSTVTAAKIPNGRFTSPHLINRWDCIFVNGRPVREQLFLEVEQTVADANKTHAICATEFEMLTAIAFEIFRRTEVKFAVIEVGLGGRLDCTNILTAEQVLSTVITKIGLDHQSFLGDTVGEIAREKGGIIKQNVPCIVDSTNDPAALEVISKLAMAKNAFLKLAQPYPVGIETLPFRLDGLKTPLHGAYQMANLSCALQALVNVRKHFPEITDATVIQGINSTKWAGRLQWLDLSNKKVLLDGAHNSQAAELLDQYITSSVRTDRQKPVTFIMAFSNGKDFEAIIKRLVKRGDKVIATGFGAVDGMPWLKACDPVLIADAARGQTSDVSTATDDAEALERCSNEESVVICGSLYLVSDVLRRYNGEVY